MLLIKNMEKLIMSTELVNTIECPSCTHRKEEVMPMGEPKLSYDCTNCNTEIKPKEGDCCVFSSHGSTECPCPEDKKSN